MCECICVIIFVDIFIKYVLTATSTCTPLSNKLIGYDYSTNGSPQQGRTISMSSDGSILAVGAPADDGAYGAVFIFMKNSQTGQYEQKGEKLTCAGFSNPSNIVDLSLALSSDGNVLAVGRQFDGGDTGAVYMFLRDSTTNLFLPHISTHRLDTSEGIGSAPHLGSSIALSHIGDILAVGSSGDNNNIGCVHIYITNEDNEWQWAQKLVGTNYVSNNPTGDHSVYQGHSIALSYDGGTLAIGGYGDNGFMGAVWIFMRDNNGIFFQPFDKLVGSTTSLDNVHQGMYISFSKDGNTLVWSGTGDDNGKGAVWVYERDYTNTYKSVGNKLTISSSSDSSSIQGIGHVCIVSGDGNIIAIGTPKYNASVGAIWMYENKNRNNIESTWIQQSNTLLISDSDSTTGSIPDLTASFSNTADILAVGIPNSNGNVGSVVVYSCPKACTLGDTILYTPRNISYVGNCYNSGSNNNNNIVSTLKSGDTCTMNCAEGFGILHNSGDKKALVYSCTNGVLSTILQHECISNLLINIYESANQDNNHRVIVIEIITVIMIFIVGIVVFMLLCYCNRKGYLKRLLSYCRNTGTHTSSQPVHSAHTMAASTNTTTTRNKTKKSSASSSVFSSTSSSSTGRSSAAYQVLTKSNLDDHSSNQDVHEIDIGVVEEENQHASLSPPTQMQDIEEEEKHAEGETLLSYDDEGNSKSIKKIKKPATSDMELVQF